MSIRVNEFEYVPGKNDAEYIKLLKGVIEMQKNTISKAAAKIKKLSAQPERKTGYWIKVDDMVIGGYCSVCGWQAILNKDDVVGMPYCPMCGARMDG